MLFVYLCGISNDGHHLTQPHTSPTQENKSCSRSDFCFGIGRFCSLNALPNWHTPSKHTGLTYLFACLLTPLSIFLLEKLSGPQLIKKFPVFHGTQNFITAFTSARHLSLSWARSIQSTPPHPTSCRSILMLSSHLRLGLPSGLFPSGYPTKTLYKTLIAPIRATFPAHFIVLDFITQIIFGEQYRSLSPSHYAVLSTPLSPCPLRPKYSPQHPVLKHPQPTFPPQCERPSITPIQNNRQNYSSVHLNLQIFG